MRIATVLAVAILGMSCLADADQAQAAMRHYQLNIPRQSLDAALKELAQQTGLQIGRFSERIDGSAMVGPVDGAQTPAQALKILLRHTALSYKIVNDTTFAVYNPNTTTATTRGDTAGCNSPPVGNRNSASAYNQGGLNSPATGSNGLNVASGCADERSQETRSFVSASEEEQQAIAPAQSTAGGSAVNSDATGADALEQIVVTAQRRAQPIDKVPMSMTALSQKDMDDRQIESLSDLVGVVPGLLLPPQTSGSGSQSDTNIVIRGVVSTDNSPTTGVYIDETPIIVRQMVSAGFSGTPQPDIFDLDRIEVLRGPQGTLFGSGAMGGAIRYITPQPNLENESGTAKAEFGDTDRGAPSYAVGLAYGAPIIKDELGFRISAWFHEDGGFIDVEDPFTGQILHHNANSAGTYVVRPSFTFAPTDGLTITPALFIQHHHSDEPPEDWLNDLPNSDGGKLASGFGAHVPQTVQDDLTVSSLAIKYDFRGLSVQSDTSYVNRQYYDYDDYSNIIPTFFGLAPVTPSLSHFYAYDQNIVFTHAFQQEFRVSSQNPDARVNWTMGAYYRSALDGIQQFVAPDLTPVTELLTPPQTSLQYFGFPDFLAGGKQYNIYNDFQTVTDQRAVFGDATVNIVAGLKANIGVRVEHSEVRDQLQIDVGPLLGLPYSKTVVPDAIETPVTPRYGLTYQYTNTGMVYFSAAKGYRAGGTNPPGVVDNPQCQLSFKILGLTNPPDTFKSDSLWSYEVGAKDSWFDRRVSLQGSAYFINWKDIQTSINLPSCYTSYDTNRDKVFIKGFDFQLAALVTESLRLTGTVGYTHAYYPDTTYGTPPAPGVLGPLLTIAGDPTQVIPWSASIYADYSRNISALWSGARSYFRVDYRWLDGLPSADPRIPGYNELGNVLRDPAYGTLALRLGVTHQGLDVSAWATNVTNSNPVLGFEPSTATMLNAQALRPRTIGATAFYRF